MFTLETPLWELFARGVILFLGFTFLFRVLPRRTGGEMAPMDLVFLFLITESASHSFGDFTSISDGGVQIGILVGLNYLTNKLAFHFPVIRYLVEQKLLPVILDGKTIDKNLQKEALSLEELLSHLRLQGEDDIGNVKISYVESDGKLSVIKLKSWNAK